MSGRFENCRRSRSWRALARVTALLFALRALVPVGFMPDLAALQDGRYEIALCTADGLRNAIADSTGQPVDDGAPAHSAPSAADCPFASVAAKFLTLPGAVGDAPARIVENLAHFAALTAADATPVRGPPLGSRAPPHLLD